MKNKFDNEFTREEIKLAVKGCNSKKEIIKKLNLKSYIELDYYLNLYQVKLKKSKPKIFKKRHQTAKELIKNVGVKNIFTFDSPYGFYMLRKIVLNENLLEYKCSLCGIVKWNGVDIPLELDHINGDRTDDRLENLRFLCLNCHATTPTYRGRNVTNRKNIKFNRCSECHAEINAKSKMCGDCKRKIIDGEKYIELPSKKELQIMLGKAGSCPKLAEELNINYHKLKHYLAKIGIDIAGTRNKNRIRPKREVLEKLLWEKSMEQIGKDYNVSGKAVAKWVKKYCLSKPDIGYWARIVSTNSWPGQD